MKNPNGYSIEDIEAMKDELVDREVKEHGRMIGSRVGLAEKLDQVESKNRAAIVAFPDAGERDVLRQLARMPRWDGFVSSKGARDSLVMKGLAARWNGYNFLTRDGFAAVDALWGLSNFIET